MPTYDYECQKCGHAFEAFQQMSAEPLKKCPECKGKVKRLLGTGAGLLFKGSGFYETDYRSESYKSGQNADKSTASKSKSSESSKKKSGDAKSKPATKSASGGSKAKAKPKAKKK